MQDYVVQDYVINEYLTKVRLAAALNVSTQTLYRWEKSWPTSRLQSGSTAASTFIGPPC
jgi:DNA-binding XRE family transcriptional regulator